MLLLSVKAECAVMNLSWLAKLNLQFKKVILSALLGMDLSIKYRNKMIRWEGFAIFEVKEGGT